MNNANLSTQKQEQQEYKNVCILSKDGQPLPDINAQLERFGYVVNGTADIQELNRMIATAKPCVVIIYSNLFEDDVVLLRQLQWEKKDPKHSPQLIVIAPRDDFKARLAAVRLGAQGFFTDKADIIQIIDKIEYLVAKHGAAPTFHVLLVEDDDMHVRFYTHVLQGAGIMTTVISEPHEALEVIKDQSIDLVLMDFIMPECNGQELATIIRQHEKYIGIPIIFLSARDDIEALMIDTGLGIDDFLVKPVTGEQLVSVVRNRAQRSAELNVLMARDSFTGLLNNAHFMDMLEVEFGQVKRFKTSTAYALIDIDHFKNINDKYGHGVGDHIIKNLSRMLQQRLRRSDIIGRCGGKEFGIIMPDCTIENAVVVVESLRQQFADFLFKIGQHEIKATFSAGLTSFSHCENLDELIKTADRALHDAKNQGHNRLVVI